MSSSSVPRMYKEQEDQEKDWLATLMQSTFFQSCSVHQNLAQNKLNRFCISCEASACKICIASGLHADHRLLKIYRHVNKDVVLHQEIKGPIDCTGIQTYRCNGKIIISLTPLPHVNSGVLGKDNLCHVCTRKLYESKNSYCSIECKLAATSAAEKTNDSGRHLGETDPEKHNRHRRKGIPCRAPLS